MYELHRRLHREASPAYAQPADRALSDLLWASAIPAFSGHCSRTVRCHSTRPRRHETAECRVHGRKSPSSTTQIPHPWAIIWGVGGACWLHRHLHGAALWMLPAGGTETGGVYVVSTAAHAGAASMMVFLAAALGYRAALALGWPRARAAQARVVLVNCLMALAVVSLVAPGALVLAAGFVDDGRLPQLRGVAREMWSQYPQLGILDDAAQVLSATLYSRTGRHRSLRVVMRRASTAKRCARPRPARACGVARMAMLSAQLQPHLLFNSLHAISVLVGISPRPGLRHARAPRGTSCATRLRAAYRPVGGRRDGTGWT